MTAHTFANGITVELGPIDRYQLARFRAALDVKYPKPEPPIQVVQYGDETEGTPNPDHPDYLRAVAAWNEEQEHRTNLLAFRFCVTPPATMDEQVATHRAEVARQTALMESLGLPETPTGFEEHFAAYDNSDLMYWLYMIACEGRVDQLASLVDAISRRLAIKEAATVAAEAMF